jgi:hypothetical protein
LRAVEKIRIGQTARYEDVNADYHLVDSKLASWIKSYLAGLFIENLQSKYGVQRE